MHIRAFASIGILAALAGATPCHASADETLSCREGSQAQCLKEAQQAAQEAIEAINLAMRHQKPADPPSERDFGLIEPIVTNASGLVIGGRKIPPTNKPDVVGAFRTFCSTSHFARVDPIVFPGQKDVGHLHRFMGNMLTDENSSYSSLRNYGDSSCFGGDLYRTAIWAPVLFDQDGMVVTPDYTTLYYKRYPAGSEKCTERGDRCVDLPVGLRAIYGTNYKTGARQNPNVRFDCSGRNISQSMGVAMQDCKPGEFLRASIAAPNCWDGKHTDAADHQSHLAYSTRDKDSGILRCPETHPLVIPTVTYIEITTLQPGDSPLKWRYSSDIMAGADGGVTFHSDYFEAIEPWVRDAFHRECIDKHLSCVAGNLGDGRKLTRPAGFSFDAKPRMTVKEALGYTAFTN